VFDYKTNFIVIYMSLLSDEIHFGIWVLPRITEPLITERYFEALHQ